MRLTEEHRAMLNKKEFVFPKERKYPIDTEKRARAALGFVAMHGSAEEKARVRAAVYRRYPNMGQEKKAEQEASKLDTASNVAIGSGAVALAPKAIEPFLSRRETRFRSGRPVHIYYTDPARGFGHYAQAVSIKKELDRKGIPNKLINAEKEFFSDADRKALVDKFRSSVRGEISKAEWDRHWLKSYFSKFDRKAFVKSADSAGAIIFTNPGLVTWARGMRLPTNVIVSDPSKAFTKVDLGSSWTGSRDTFYATREASNYRGPETRRIKNVPIDPDAFYKNKPPRSFSKRNFNVTISGGGTGIDTLAMTRDLVSKSLPKAEGRNIKLHVIAGTLNKDNPEEYKELRALKRRNPGRIVLYDKLPSNKVFGMLQNSQLNVLRPHGTMGTEAMAAKVPVLFVARGGLDSSGALKLAEGMNSKNARVFADKTNTNIAGIGGATTKSSLRSEFLNTIRDYSVSKSKALSSADKVENSARKIVDDITTNRLIDVKGRIPFSKHMATAGALSLGAGAAYKGYKKYMEHKGKQ